MRIAVAVIHPVVHASVVAAVVATVDRSEEAVAEVGICAIVAGDRGGGSAAVEGMDRRATASEAVALANAVVAASAVALC